MRWRNETVEVLAALVAGMVIGGIGGLAAGSGQAGPVEDGDLPGEVQQTEGEQTEAEEVAPRAETPENVVEIGRSLRWEARFVKNCEDQGGPVDAEHRLKVLRNVAWWNWTCARMDWAEGAVFVDSPLAAELGVRDSAGETGD